MNLFYIYTLVHYNLVKPEQFNNDVAAAAGATAPASAALKLMLKFMKSEFGSRNEKWTENDIRPL